MRRLTLKWRVVLYTAIVHVLVALAGAFVLLLNAQHAVRAEIVAAQDSAVTLIEQLAEPIASRAASDISLTDLASRLVQPRHVQITIVPEDTAFELLLQQPLQPIEVETEEAPSWFLQLVSPDIATRHVPLVASGDIIGHAEVSALPRDEATEVWEDVQSLFLVWALSTLALLGLITVAISRALAPIQRLQDALRHLEAGNYSIRAAETDSPDLKPIGVRIDRLTQTLQSAERDRSTLSRQLLHLRDAERKELARELHDELGPCLFGLTVEVDAIRQKPSDMARSLETIDQLVGRIRATNARILNTLRPQTIGQLPLTDVILDLLSDFEAANPEVAFESELQPLHPPIDEVRDLTVYRVVQEAITNALRHGATKRVRVSVALEDRASQRLLVNVRDFGHGLTAEWQEGRGIIGMRERLKTLNGTLSIKNASGQGTVLQAILSPGQRETAKPYQGAHPLEHAL